MENTLLKLSEDDKLKLVLQTRKRLDSSLKYYSVKRETWRKCYKIYRAIKDERSDDEPNIGLAVAFGLVEDIVARIVGPALGKLNIMVKPKRDDHTQQAENYYNMARSYYGSSEYRVEWVNACRERVITGGKWEFDEWANDYSEGFRWGMRDVMSKASELMPTLAGMAEKMGLMSKIREMTKIKKLFPLRVGVKTHFPSMFRVHPQPGVKKFEDLKWIIEVIPFAALDDLKKAQYTIDGQSFPIYDLSKFLGDKKNAPEVVIRPVWPTDDDNIQFEAEYTDVDNSDIDYDVDGLHLLKVRTPNEIYVIANGNTVIQHITNPFFKPGIKARLRVYTQDTQALNGIGVIEPLIEMFEELDDVHNMAMENWIRVIHKMIIYNEIMVPYPDDFNARSGGRIRADGSKGNIRDAFLPVDHEDVTGTMITTEQNLRGYIGSIASISDMTPGPMGTKPFHKTYRGLIEIETQYAKRFSVTLLLDQAETMKQMNEQYYLYDQFMFEPQSFTECAKGAGAVQYTREDIDTDGLGFEFSASDDPSFGDAGVLRNQWMVLLDKAMAYE